MLLDTLTAADDSQPYGKEPYCCGPLPPTKADFCEIFSAFVGIEEGKGGGTDAPEIV